ncbi:MAG: glycosyltransferase family 4 protein [Desulfobacterales bacterium]|nr:glycosyltransferase family 4 protein [Desulfobacterales bacterium]
MKIGVDARSLSSPLTGIGQYTFQLLKRLILDFNNEWYIYSSSPLRVDLPLSANVTIRLSKCKKLLSKMIWSQTILPLWAKKDGIDLLWSPRHHLPLLIPGNIKTLVTIHDLVWRVYPETMKYANLLAERVLMPRSLRKADGIICVSNSTRNDLKKSFPACDHKSTVIYEASSLSTNIDFENNVNHARNTSEYILFVGTLEPRKNLIRLLKAYAQLPTALKEKYSLIILGGKGWGNVDIDEISTELEIKDNIKLIGYVSDSEMISYFRNATILAMPSLYEGFGLPILDAMQLGIPVLTSKNSSMVELTKDTAILVKPLDINDIYIKLKMILTDDDLRKTLSKKGLLHAKYFSWDFSAQQTYDYMKRLCHINN